MKKADREPERKGFSVFADRELLELDNLKMVMPKREGKNKAEQERKVSKRFKQLHAKHKALELHWVESLCGQRV